VPRGAAQAALFGNGDDGTQMMELHGGNLAVGARSTERHGGFRDPNAITIRYHERRFAIFTVSSRGLLEKHKNQNVRGDG